MNVAKILALHSEVSRVSRALGRPYLSGMARFLWLTILRKFSPAEVFRLALLDPAISWRDLGIYRAKEVVWPLFESGNRHQDLRLLNHKDDFHQACAKHGLADLDCLKFLSLQELKSWAALGEDDLRASVSAFLSGLPAEFVTKPSVGYGGVGVEFFRKSGESVSNWNGSPLADAAFAKILFDSLSAQTVAGDLDLASNRLIVQAVAYAHPLIEQISGASPIQSVRIATCLESGGPRILFGFLKLAGRGNLIDNYQTGESGNLIACVDEESGRIYRVVGRDRSSGVARLLTAHPDTGAPLIGLAVPYWAEACELAMRAAACFPNTKAVGWDIGISPSGPLLIEGNGTWNPVVPLYRWGERPLPLSDAVARTRSIEIAA